MSADRWGPPPIKKKFPFFWVKIPIFFGFFFGSNFAECRHSAKALPSARQKTLGKDVFADSFFAECSLPSAALGKAFAECKLGFAECPWHSANSLSPVVPRLSLLDKLLLQRQFFRIISYLFISNLCHEANFLGRSKYTS